MRLYPIGNQQDAKKSDSRKFVPFGVNPWLAYVLVRQLCFIVADEDVRHAQPPQSARYSENNSNLDYRRKRKLIACVGQVFRHSPQEVQSGAALVLRSTNLAMVGQGLLVMHSPHSVHMA